MKTNPAVVLTVLVGLLALVGCQSDKQFYCGRRLSAVLAMLCENGLIKRSDNQLPPPEDSDLLWIPAHHAKSMGRGKRQVVSECCFKPCMMSELLSYCAE